MKERITILLEYENKHDIPQFGANMVTLGGKIIAVQFGDALDENERLHDELNCRGNL